MIHATSSEPIDPNENDDSCRSQETSRKACPAVLLSYSTLPIRARKVHLQGSGSFPSLEGS